MSVVSVAIDGEWFLENVKSGITNGEGGSRGLHAMAKGEGKERAVVCCSLGDGG